MHHSMLNANRLLPQVQPKNISPHLFCCLLPFPLSRGMHHLHPCPYFALTQHVLLVPWPFDIQRWNSVPGPPVHLRLAHVLVYEGLCSLLFSATARNRSCCGVRHPGIKPSPSLHTECQPMGEGPASDRKNTAAQQCLPCRQTHLCISRHRPCLLVLCFLS